MKTTRSRNKPTQLCDTVSHKSSGEAISPPPGGPDARLVRTDKALREAFLTLLGREPLDAITIRQICTEAGVHYATFFRHHASKEALLDHVAKDQIDHLIALTLPISDSNGTKIGLEALFAYVDEHRKLWSVLLTGGARGAMRGELLRVSLALAAERAAPNTGMPIELATICSVTLIVETIAWWLVQPDGQYSISTVAQMLDQLLQSPLLDGSRR